MTTANNTAILSVASFTHFVGLQNVKNEWNIDSGFESKDFAVDKQADMIIGEGHDKKTVRVWNRANAMKNVAHACTFTGKPADKEADKLNKTEKARLTALIKSVRSNLKAYVNLGLDLMEIRDDRLYRETHTSFKDFCSEKFDLDDGYATRTINAAHAAGIFMANAMPVPNTESQARELTIFLKTDNGLSIDMMIEFWQGLCDIEKAENAGKEVYKHSNKRKMKSAAWKLTAKMIKEQRKLLYPTKQEKEKAAELAQIEANKAAQKETAEAANKEVVDNVDSNVDSGEAGSDESKTEGAFAPDMGQAQEKIEELTNALKEKEDEARNLAMGNKLVTKQLDAAKKAAAPLPDHDLMKSVLAAGFKAMAAELSTNQEAMMELINLRKEIDAKLKFSDFDISTLIKS